MPSVPSLLVKFSAKFDFKAIIIRTHFTIFHFEITIELLALLHDLDHLLLPFTEFLLGWQVGHSHPGTERGEGIVKVHIGKRVGRTGSKGTFDHLTIRGLS
jgi:hypothetical protein